MMLRAAGATAPAPLRRDEIAMEIMIGRVLDVDVDASFNAACCSVKIADADVLWRFRDFERQSEKRFRYRIVTFVDFIRLTKY